jgi:hypothetical protein
VKVFGFQPGAEPGIVNLRLALPKVRLQPTLNLKVIQVQLNNHNMPGKITPDIGSSHMQPSQATAFALCFDHHMCLLFNAR